MPSGTRGAARLGSTSTEYAQPFGGTDLSKPPSQIDASSFFGLNGSIIRGGLAPSPAVGLLQSSVPVNVPTWGGTQIMLVANLNGATYVVTTFGVYTDLTAYGGSPLNVKNFQLIYTFPTPLLSNSQRVGSVIIGNNLYFSSSLSLGVYRVHGQTVQEISAQNGSGPFIGGDFLFTIANRLCLANIIGGDGNQTGHVTGATISNGGTGYPATGTGIFVGGGGQSATFSFTSSGGVINSITITNAGSGYLSAPTPQIVGTTGTGFVGTATISGFTSNSTTTHYPDYVAWSFPSAFGSFDPNSILLGGGFNQITEARGCITGVAVFEAVGMIAHNGGFTEMVPNTSSAVGTNIQPFTFAPLWSADQGVVCRYGSMAQYGALVCFLGVDQPYQLTPNGLTPFGSKVASQLQNYSIWNDPNNFVGGFFVVNSGTFGSIVEIEGEKHYLLSFTSNTTGNLTTQIFDCCLALDAWSTYTYPFQQTAPIYQSFDTQETGTTGVPTGIARDNWILIPFNVSTAPAITLGQMFYGQQLYSLTIPPLYANPQFSLTGRMETPFIGIPQTSRRLMIEYENIPNATAPNLSLSLWGQPPNTNGGAQSTPLQNGTSLQMTYYPLATPVPPSFILTSFTALTGTAATFTSTQLTLSTVAAALLRIVRIAIVADTSQTEIQ